VLRPFDGIVPHRLDLNTPLKQKGSTSLGAFWKKLVTQWFESRLVENKPILNLASMEYDRLLTAESLRNRAIGLEFLERKNGRLKNGNKPGLPLLYLPIHLL